MIQLALMLAGVWECRAMFRWSRDGPTAPAATLTPEPPTPEPSKRWFDSTGWDRTYEYMYTCASAYLPGVSGPQAASDESPPAGPPPAGQSSLNTAYTYLAWAVEVIGRAALGER